MKVYIAAFIIAAAIIAGVAYGAPQPAPPPCDCTYVIPRANDTQSGNVAETTINLKDLTFMQRPNFEGGATSFTLRLGNATVTALHNTETEALTEYNAIQAALDNCLCNC